MTGARSWKGKMTNENKILVVQKNPFGADVEIDVNVDDWVRGEIYHEAKKERRGLMRIKIRRIKNGGADTGKQVA